MRVLLVNDAPLEGGWGAEQYVERLAEGLRCAGDEVDVLAGAVAHQGWGKLRDVWDPAARRLVDARARAFSAEVVHFHNVLREMSVSVLGVPRGVPKVLSVHDLRILGTPDHPRGRVGALAVEAKSRLDRAVARRQIDVALAVSDPIATALRGAGFRAVQVVTVPVRPPASPPVPVADCTSVLFAGRLTPDKGVDVLLQAFRDVAPDAPQAQLRIAGAGDAEDALRSAARSDGERVRFLGRLDPVALSRELGQARVVVVPSVPARRPEGSPMVVAEAAAHGRPVVGSDDPGIESMIRELGCGLTVPAGSPSDLADALRAMLLDDEAASRYGAQGASAVTQRHSAAAVAADVRRVYLDLIGARR